MMIKLYYGQKNKAPTADGNRLRKWELCALLSLCLGLCAGVWAQRETAVLRESVVRLHVVAVSDEAEEQRVKLLVRDAVLACLTPRLRDCGGPADARLVIGESVEALREAALSAADGRQVTVSLCEEYYPTRRYEGFALPAGRYESLRVTLGEGRGRNWWCVVFPPLCLSAAEATQAMETLPEGSASLIEGGDGTVILRFRIAELWGELLELLSRD